MSEFAIEVEGGKSVRLKTAGKYCDRNIVVTATGGGDTDAAYQQGVADGRLPLRLSASWSNMFYQRDYRTEYPQGVELTLEYGEYFTGAINNMCRYTWGLKSIKIIGNKDVVLNVASVFANCHSLETVDLTECSTSFTNIQNPFNGAAKLKTIKGELNFTAGATIVSPFASCNSLVDVRFVEGCIEKNMTFQWSPLSADSMKSIILGLKNYAGTDSEYTYTLTFNDDCWTALLADGTTAPNGDTWKSYVQNKGWNI